MKKKTIAIYALAGLLLVGCLYYFFRAEGITPEASSAKTPAKQEVLFENTALVEEKDGKRLWELNAEAVNVDVTAKKVNLTKVNATFYREDGSKVNVVAHSGIADIAKQEVFLNGEVTAVSAADGATFTAPHVRWAGEIRWFFAEGGVKLVRDDTVITGDKLDSDVNMEKVKVRGNAKVRKGGGN